MYILKSQGQSMVLENHYLTIPEALGGVTFERELSLGQWTGQAEGPAGPGQGNSVRVDLKSSRVYGAASWRCMWVRRG